jgi:CheY-like chemotaxis protein
LSRENAQPLTNGVILLIEDNSDDVELFRLAIAQSGSQSRVVAVSFGRDAIKYLDNFGEFANKTEFPKPTLIVLDLSLPGMTGFDFLSWARGEPPGTIPPIVVLSYSKIELNRTLAARLGAKAYFVKSPNLSESSAMARELLLFNAPPSSSVKPQL